MTSKIVRVVADSTCDLPKEVVEKWKIGVVPAFVNYGGKSYADDGVELDRHLYYQQMPGMTSQPTTAAPPPALVTQVIHEAAQEADHLIMLTVPAVYSGIYNAFRLGAADLPPEKVTLIDSGTVSMGLGFQTLVAAEVGSQTGDPQAVVEAVKRVRAHQNLYAVPEVIDYLRRSGRLGWAAASAAALLQIRPIISAKDSDFKVAARVRTFSKAVEKVIELIQADAPLERLALLHANNPEGAEDIKNRLGNIVPAETYIINVTPVIGTHIGPGALGVATLSQAWRQ